LIQIKGRSIRDVLSAQGHERRFKRKSRTSAFAPTYRRVAPGDLSTPRDEARRIAANIAKPPELLRTRRRLGSFDEHPESFIVKTR
jgi:hypothetical protein